MTDAIYNRVENGETPLVASVNGSKSVTFAIISTTLVLVAVFLPLIFIEGISGTLFKETAISLTFAIVVSSFVALTLSPMLGSKFLNRNTKKSKIVLKFEKYYKSFLEFYSETLNYWINKQNTIIGFMFFIPFLIVDLVVASVLMAMGMMMLSPMIVSLPFKIMLFVLVDGWSLVMGTLAKSFGLGT